jgi:hypothetical protein
MSKPRITDNRRKALYVFDAWNARRGRCSNPDCELAAASHSVETGDSSRPDAPPPNLSVRIRNLLLIFILHVRIAASAQGNRAEKHCLWWKRSASESGKVEAAGAMQAPLNQEICFDWLATQSGELGGRNTGMTRAPAPASKKWPVS